MKITKVKIAKTGLWALRIYNTRVLVLDGKRGVPSLYPTQDRAWMVIRKRGKLGEWEPFPATLSGEVRG